MTIRIEIEGLDEIRQRFAQAPQKLKDSFKKTMEATLLKLWQYIPGYPEPPPNSRYRRTYTLGRTLGSSASGGQSGAGRPDIYFVKQGHRYTEGQFGTRLKYAPHVIGEGTQAPVHEGRWWTLDGTVVKRAIDAITGLWRTMAETLARFLDKGI